MHDELYKINTLNKWKMNMQPNLINNKNNKT